MDGRWAAAVRTHGTVCGADAPDGAARGGGTRGTRPHRRASPAPPACRPPCHRFIAHFVIHKLLTISMRLVGT